MIKRSRVKIALSDALLLGKKIGVTVLIYLTPAIIIVGGLLLTAHVFKVEQEPENKTEINVNQNQ